MDFELDYLEEKQVGNWKIEKFSISKEQADFYNLISKDHRYDVVPGNYKRLLCGNEVIMSNTNLERNTHKEAIEKAKGVVLVAGLGLGMYIYNILKKPEVETILVVEKSKEVISMVSDYFRYEGKVIIVNKDIFDFDFHKKHKFDFAFFDIWSNICEDNKKDFKVLRRKFKNIKEKIFWSEDLL